MEPSGNRSRSSDRRRNSGADLPAKRQSRTQPPRSDGAQGSGPASSRTVFGANSYSKPNGYLGWPEAGRGTGCGIGGSGVLLATFGSVLPSAAAGAAGAAAAVSVALAGATFGV